MTPWQAYLERRRTGRSAAEDAELIWLTDGPDYSLAYLLRLAERREADAARAGRRKVPAIPAEADRCSALVPNRSMRTGAQLPGKHRCTKKVLREGYCGIHRYLLIPGNGPDAGKAYPC